MRATSPVRSQPSSVIVAAVASGIVQVADHHLRAADPQLAGFVRQRRRAPVSGSTIRALGARRQHARGPGRLRARRGEVADTGLISVMP